MLRVDPRQKRRLVEILRNLTDRIKEAQANGWHGEVEGLRTSRQAAEAKLASLNRTIQREHSDITSLGMPTVPARCHPT